MTSGGATPRLHAESDRVEPMVRERICVLTGAAGGIGRHTTARLIKAGFLVVATDVDDEGLARLPRSEHLLTRCFDLRDRDAFARLVDEIRGELGTVDTLVNNAGVGIPASVVETNHDDWDRIMDINVSAMYRACRAVLPSMIEAGRGVIVNVSSAAGLVGLKRRAAYCASKSAVIGLTRALAVDHAAQGIRANAICPGTVETEWVERMISDSEDPVSMRQRMAERQLDGRMGGPDEIAAAIAFLASDDARFVNGSAFVIDGGLTAQ